MCVLVWCDTALSDPEWRREDAKHWSELSTHGRQSMVSCWCVAHILQTPPKMVLFLETKRLESLLLFTLCFPLLPTTNLLSRTELVFSVTRELLSVPSSSLSPPLFMPPNLLSLFSRYVDRQRLDLLQDKLQWVPWTNTKRCSIHCCVLNGFDVFI